MVSLRRSGDSERGEEIAIESAAAHARGGGRIAPIISAVALVLSVYSLWETTLKRADLHVFVPPVLQYSAPYQNSNFEMIAIPVTLTNDGAQTGTVLSMELTVTDSRTNATKRGPWSERAAAATSRSRRSRWPDARVARRACCSTRAVRRKSPTS
jgi:hypothetical protein